jgi:alanine-glyoxylate transaminase/(R)-3-amino-2-methylpropionate-pyruvate transaminase
MLVCIPGGVAGFISESIQGVGGSVPLADGYLPAVYDVRPPVHTSPLLCLGQGIMRGRDRAHWLSAPLRT